MSLLKKIALWFTGIVTGWLLFFRRRGQPADQPPPTHVTPPPAPPARPTPVPPAAPPAAEPPPAPVTPVVPESTPPAATLPPAPAPAAVTPQEAPPAKPPPIAPDDLTLIEGIGPKIAAALSAAGVDSFAKLAARAPAELEDIVKAAGVRLVGHAESWPRQGELAASGDMEALRQYQAEVRARRGRAAE